MPAQSLVCNVLIVLLAFFMLPNLSLSDDSSLPHPTLSFGWLDGKDVFRAGETAAIRVTILKNFKTLKERHSFNPNISMNDTMGNSNFITGISFSFNDDTNIWRIFFMPIMVGLFNVLITEDNFKVFSSSMHYHVTPDQIYEPGGIVSCMGQVNYFVAGTKATVLILPKDAFGNNVTLIEEQNVHNFVVYATNLNGSNANLVNMVNKGRNEFGYICIEFIVVTSGSLLVHVKHKNDSLIGSPLSLTVHPGALDIGNCVPQWSTETKYFQLFSTMETFIHQRDKFGNLVPGRYEFDFEVMQKGANLSLPISDLQYKEVFPGVQSFSFKLVEPGDFILVISDKDKKNQILNMPYEFNVYIGYCDGFRSIVNGSGLDKSVAGEVSKFHILLKDAYEYPSPLDLEKLQVLITLPSLSLRVYPHISPRDSVNGTQPTGMLGYDAFGPAGITSIPSAYLDNKPVGSWKTRSSDFDVAFVPEKSGIYEIHIFCGNIPLNDGRPFLKVVSAGEVNSSISGVVKYTPKVSISIMNNITVKMMDSFSNPVSLQQSNLKLEIASINVSHFFACKFDDNNDGTYTGYFLILDPGTYEMCVSFNGRRFLPYPFGVKAYDSKYFPTAYSDTVNVWEDESIAFNALQNDYFAGGNAKIVEFQKPSHGSVLQYGIMLRYTPFKGFYGNDTFIYTLSDVNGNVASAAVYIHVRTSPPLFVSFPSQLQATEGVLSPQFGGFPSIEVKYSDSLENISIMLSAQHGSIFLSPLSMQLWDPMWNQLSVSKAEGITEYLYLIGCLKAVNFGLQSLKYIGKENFSGTDTIRVSAININGKRDLEVPIFVEPINDPPYINMPKFIILNNENEDEGFLIFDRERDNFNFSIGDPDHLHFPGNETHFRVLFSVEFSSGYFSAKLPAKLISTTELKLKNSRQWQPLQTFVEISKQFTVKAKGIRFRGTINDCNTLLQQLLYFGGKQGGALKVSVNDMGWYGCYPDCANMMSVPLISEATVNLITRMPMNPLVAHSFGSVIVIESVVLSLLGVILMFFTCKCVIVLLREKKKNQVQSQNLQLYEPQSFHEQMSSTGSSENMIQLTGNDPNPLTQSGQPSN